MRVIRALIQLLVVRMEFPGYQAAHSRDSSVFAWVRERSVKKSSACIPAHFGELRVVSKPASPPTILTWVPSIAGALLNSTPKRPRTFSPVLCSRVRCKLTRLSCMNRILAASTSVKLAHGFLGVEFSKAPRSSRTCWRSGGSPRWQTTRSRASCREVFQ